MTIVIKRVLASTLKEIAEKKSLSKITINDLTQACDVSRQTFYNNFKDIYDLVEWIYLKEVVTPIERGKIYDKWQDALTSIFQYISENHVFVLNTYRSFGKEFLEKVLRQEIELFLSNQVFKKIEVTKEEAKQVEFSYSFYTYALVGVGLDWIEKQMPESVEELVERIERVMLGQIISLL
ncbi:TetR/AcrR family transcriptional regulator [Gemella morbillorum]|uniref:TetR/AcrR family transcriptional regulator n=1 Tax=Gemella morbillorum TaxID=29391 RepID=UPI00254D75B3|nr:TetR-like C-terminal domain-containing protein [Gemella morbillorum]MDK8239957.1 TetR-like C-terminal domain-containing protein [Gemella morbillorum]MDK8255185.1 TetR-like C-terminal domain-containing protein [Gemella morbillorum]